MEKNLERANHDNKAKFKQQANIPDIITNTPEKPSNPSYGCNDVTERWLRNAKPGQGSITDVTRFMQDGKIYEVDGVNVKLNSNSKGEKELAEL